MVGQAIFWAILRLQTQLLIHRLRHLCPSCTLSGAIHGMGERAMDERE
jgi:hypothetical protein